MKNATKTVNTINAADAGKFAEACFAVDSATSARELISEMIKAWRKAGIKLGRDARTCPNKAVIKDALGQFYNAKRVPDVLYCVAMAVNEGITFSTDKAATVSRAKTAGKRVTPAANSKARLPGNKASKTTTPSKAVVTAPTAPGKYTTTGSVLDALADMVLKIKESAGPELWAKTMKIAPVGTGSALDELLRAQAKE